MMETMGVRRALTAMASWEVPVCMAVQRAGQGPWPHSLFALVSRLGDGVIWYACMTIAPIVAGRVGWLASSQMALAGAFGLIFYRKLKRQTSRLRPFQADCRIRKTVAPLDSYSFPSGHTLHAVAFSVILISHFAVLGWLLIPFTLLVMLSRVVLGLHYPSDVVVGALAGYGCAIVSLTLLNF